jgi:hypothetical protein
MRLEATRSQELIRYEPNDLAVRWKIDLFADIDPESTDKPSEYPVARAIMDEMRLYEIEEHRVSAWDVADADSDGLEAAWAAIATKRGKFPFSKFPTADTVVYIYRFEVHPDFAAWRMPFMDSICRVFGNTGIILAQYHTTWLNQSEFKALGFQRLKKSTVPAQMPHLKVDRKIRFLLRDNSRLTSFNLSDYPEEAPLALPTHAKWLEVHGPWEGLC